MGRNPEGRNQMKYELLIVALVFFISVFMAFIFTRDAIQMAMFGTIQLTFLTLYLVIRKP